MSDKESLIDGIINLLTGKKNEPISVEGYEFAGRVKLGRHPLVLNGAGVRTIGDKKDLRVRTLSSGKNAARRYCTRPARRTKSRDCHFKSVGRLKIY